MSSARRAPLTTTDEICKEAVSRPWVFALVFGMLCCLCWRLLAIVICDTDYVSKDKHAERTQN